MLTNPFLHWIDVIYSFILKIGSNLQSLFLLYMRITWGHQFIITGISKLRDIEATVAFFTKFGIPTPYFHAYEVGIVESVCGILILIGFASRLAALPLIFVMLTAFSTVHVDVFASLKFLQDPHILVLERPYPYLLTCLILFFFGPGRISIDAWVKRWVDNQPRY